ncbi:MAG: hypothetical protein RL685_2651 [Pseudomonadota bacterium]
MTAPTRSRGGRVAKLIQPFALALALLWTLGCSDRPLAKAPSLTSGEHLEISRTAKVVRVAELEIDPAQLDEYLAIVKEEMEESIRVEPGVLAIHAVAHKDDPTKLTFFEMYADEAAYLSHRESPHFKRYVESTKDMIKARKLTEMTPVQLSTKTR